MEKELDVILNSKSSVSEALKTVRTNLSFSNIDKETKKIMVTSSIPGEGKSFIAANLAASYANLGKDVLLVDCDLRRGRQHEIFEVSNKNGLSDLLITNIESKYDKVIQNTVLPNLFILTMGTIPPNPSELLESKKMEKVIEKIEDKYDYILFDCPPITGLNDALALVKYMDSVVIVCALKTTPIDLLDKTKKALLNVNAHIAGVIVNKTESSSNSYYSSYYTKEDI